MENLKVESLAVQKEPKSAAKWVSTVAQLADLKEPKMVQQRAAMSE